MKKKSGSRKIMRGGIQCRSGYKCRKNTGVCISDVGGIADIEQDKGIIGLTKCSSDAPPPGVWRWGQRSL